MDKFAALEVLRKALTTYVISEECSGENTIESEQIDKAWKVIKSEIFKDKV